MKKRNLKWLPFLNNNNLEVCLMADSVVQKWNENRKIKCDIFTWDIKLSFAKTTPQITLKFAQNEKLMN